MKHSHTISIGKDGIAYVSIVGDGDKADAERFVADAERVFSKENGHVFDAIVNMTKSGDSTYDGVLVYRQFLTHPQIGKVAFIVQPNSILKLLITMAAALKGNDARIFENEDGAKKWIRGKETSG